MKALQITLLITSVALFLALAACGGSEGADEPEPTPPDTVAVAPPDTVDLPSWVVLWHKDTEMPKMLEELDCLLGKEFRMRGQDSLYNESSQANIIGTWKLLLYFNYFGAKSDTDCSCRSIFYTFNADSTVTVVSDTTVIQSGTFKYTYTYPPYGSPMSIGEEKYDHCHVADPILTLTPAAYQLEDMLITPPGVGIFYKIE